jgi:hypothetical protein
MKGTWRQIDWLARQWQLPRGGVHVQKVEGGGSRVQVGQEDLKDDGPRGTLLERASISCRQNCTGAPAGMPSEDMLSKR